MSNSYASEAPVQHELLFSDCTLAKFTVSAWPMSALSALFSALNHCCTALRNASCTLLAFFADVSMQLEMPFSLHQVSISNCDTCRSSIGTSDYKKTKKKLCYLVSLVIYLVANDNEWEM